MRSPIIVLLLVFSIAWIHALLDDRDVARDDISSTLPNLDALNEDDGLTSGDIASGTNVGDSDTNANLDPYSTQEENLVSSADNSECSSDENSHNKKRRQVENSCGNLMLQESGKTGAVTVPSTPGKATPDTKKPRFRKTTPKIYNEQYANGITVDLDTIR